MTTSEVTAIADSPKFAGPVLRMRNMRTPIKITRPAMLPPTQWTRSVATPSPIIVPPILRRPREKVEVKSGLRTMAMVSGTQ